MIRVAIVLLISLQTTCVSAGDWPQILGPNRDGIADESLTVSWPEKGPVEVWSAEVGTRFFRTCRQRRQSVSTPSS